MLHRLRRHPFPVVAHFRHALALAYAFPREALEPLLPPGLVLDTHGEHAFAAVALVQTERLRPARAPASLGRDFFLAGYRIFARMRGAESLRGLYILRSETDRRTMALFGNLLTHYNYRLADVEVRAEATRLEVEVREPGSPLHVVADLSRHELPPGSPFASVDEARRFAGPLPYTFDHERETDSFVVIRGVRSNWNPQTVAVDVRRCDFLERLAPHEPVLANAFHVDGVDYRWERGELMSPHRGSSRRR